MRFSRLNRPSSEVNVNVIPYLVDWDRAKEVSKPQGKVKQFLRPYWHSHVCLEEFRIPGSLLRVDLLNLTRHLSIEVSPSGSHSYNPFFHKSRPRFGMTITRELDKAKWLEQNGFKLIEIFEDDFAKLSPEWFLSKYDVTL